MIFRLFRPLLDTITEYADITTINGVIYVFSNKFSRLSHAFWFLIGIILIVISTLLIQQGYKNWQEKPIYTTVSTTGLPIKNIAFPTITICGLGMVDSVLNGAILRQVKNYIKEKYRSKAQLNMMPNETYQDLITRNNLSYADFLISWFSPNTTNIKDRIEQYLVSYALYTAVFSTEITLNNYLTLFTKFQLSYSDFLAELYPSLPDSLDLYGVLLKLVTDYVQNKTNGNANITLSTSEEITDIFTNNGVNYTEFQRETFPWYYTENTPSNIILRQIQNYAYSKVKKIPSYTLRRNETVLEFFSEHNLSYPDILKNAFPVLPQDTQPEYIVDALVSHYILSHIQGFAILNLLPNETYKDLFQKNSLLYVDFLKEKYPGLNQEMSLTDIIPVLASPQPDTLLQIKMAVAGTYVQSQEFLQNRGIVYCGGPEYTFDAYANLCYRLTDGWFSHYLAPSFCSRENEALFSIMNDDQLAGLSELILNYRGPLANLSDAAFWTTAWRQAPNVWANTIPADFAMFFKDNTTSPYKSIILNTPLNNMAMTKFVLNYNKSAGNFIFSGALDKASAMVLCIKTGNSPDVSLKRTNRTITLLDNLLNPLLWTHITDYLEGMRKDYKAAFDNMNMAASYKSLFEVLWYSQVPCFDTRDQSNALIKRCEWKGVKMDCSAIFRTFPTDRGMCCTFNMAAADDIFYNTSYKQMINSMQVADSNNNANNSEVKINRERLIPRAGTRKGLSLILDAHSDLLSKGSVSEDFKEFLAILGSSNEYPLLNENSIQIRPGHNNLVAVTATDVTASLDIKLVNPKRRNCLFNDEFQLKLHRNYSQENCLLECQIEYAANLTLRKNSTTHNNHEIHGCTPWFLPKMDNNKICDPWTAKYFTDEMLGVPEDACDHCLPDCMFTNYATEVTAVPFRPCNEQNLGVSLLCNLDRKDIIDPPIFADQLAKEYGNNIPNYAQYPTNIRTLNNNSKGSVFQKLVGVPYDAYQVDIAKVTFYFKSSTVMQYSRNPSMYWTDFISQIGGLLGFCNGFSLCSLVEIFFWFTCRLWYNATKEKPRKVT